MSVKIDVQFEQPPQKAARDPTGIFGGVKVEAGGLVLTKREVNGEIREYIGERLSVTLHQIYDAIESVASSNILGSDRVTAKLATDTAEKYAVVLSGYDGESVNMSLRNGSDRDEIPDPSPAARSGRRVSIEELCLSGIDLLEQYREYRERVQKHLEQMEAPNGGSIEGVREINRKRIRETEERIERLQQFVP